MTSIIVVFRWNKVLAACNATCYDAKTSKCKCVCEGINHGVGLSTAIANTLVDRAPIVAHIQANYPRHTMISIWNGDRLPKKQIHSTSTTNHEHLPEDPAVDGL